MDLYEKSLRLAEHFHAGQTDDSGVPYIEHVKAVSGFCLSEDGKIAGLLHDIIEDTECTADILQKEEIPFHIIEAVLLLTKKEGIDEKEYFFRMCENPLAKEVKIADILHNMDLSRLENPTKYQLKRNVKYLHRLSFLLGREEWREK